MLVSLREREKQREIVNTDTDAKERRHLNIRLKKNQMLIIYAKGS